VHHYLCLQLVQRIKKTRITHIRQNIKQQRRGATTTYASASSSASGTYSRVDQECLRREKNHELIGAAVGGSLGAWAGKELIGGTTGTSIVTRKPLYVKDIRHL